MSMSMSNQRTRVDSTHIYELALAGTGFALLSSCGTASSTLSLWLAAIVYLLSSSSREKQTTAVQRSGFVIPTIHIHPPCETNAPLASTSQRL